MTDTLAYAGIAPCGCLMAALTADANDRSVRDFYRDAANDGYEVRRLPTEAVRKRLFEHDDGACQKAAA